jgi:acyl-CoA hydrolase
VSLVAEHLRAGDRVLVGQALAEPPKLVQQLVAAAEAVPNVTAYCGYTLGTAWDDVQPGGLHVCGYIAHGALRRLASRGLLDVLPWHLSAFEENLASGRLPVDVVLLQVGPRDLEGYYNLGATVDYALAAIPHARVVLLEVNHNMPHTTSSRRLHESSVTEALTTDSDLLVHHARPATYEEREVARRVASLVPDDGCLQLGLGPLANEVVAGLADRRGLRVRAGLVGDWLVKLYESGTMADNGTSTVTSVAIGSRRLYEFLDRNFAVGFASMRDLLDPRSMDVAGPLIAINSAMEVDLSGQVNSEVAGNRYVGGVGGQVDFLRAARARAGGLAIIGMASTYASGESRIVPTLRGTVTALRSDVDIVVTEFGVADLRAASLSQRREMLIGIATPEQRSAIAAAQ